MKRSFDITIVGAGIAGLATALQLAQCRYSDALRVSVIDAAKRPTFSSDDEIALRVSAISSGSAALFEKLGAWDIIRDARVSPYESMRVWDERDVPESSATLRFDAAEFAITELGFIVENVLVRQALLTRLDATDVELNFETTIDEIPKADLVIGADGARSKVRELAGIATKAWPYAQTAVVTHLETQRPHSRTAWQRFLKEGPLGVLPLSDGRVSVVWSTTPEMAEEALAANDDVLGEMITNAADAVLGKMTVAGPKAAFPLCAQHAEHYVLPGIALVGDAAHAIHPLAGQGANLGLQDTMELVDVIDSALREGLHPGDRPVLRRYERSRKGANLTMLHLMTGLNSLFTTDSRLVGEIRSAGMRLFNRAGPIRERAVRVALGVN